MDPSFTAAPLERLKQAATRIRTFLIRYRKPIQYAFGLAVLAFLGLYIYRHAQELADYSWSLDISSLLLAFGLTMVVQFLTPLTWGFVLWRCLQARLAWRESLVIWYLSQVSKYLPGGVWNYVSRVYLCTEQGIPPSKAVLSMILEIVLILLAQATTVLLTLPFWMDGARGSLWVLLILPLGAILLQPRIFNGVLAIVARKSGFQDPPQVNLGLGTVAAILGIYTLGAIMVGISFFFFASSLYPLPLELLPRIAGIINLSLIVGFLAPFAPYGLGVREGLLTLLLSLYVPPPVAAVIALASRLWYTFAELVGLLIAWLLRHF